MRAICRWARKMEIMPRDIVASVSPPKVERKEMQTLNPLGVAALLVAAEGSEMQAPIAVLVGTGLRRGELLGLKWTDIDLETQRLSVRRSVEVVGGEWREKPPKTARSARTLALAPFVATVLRQQKRSQFAVHGAFRRRTSGATKARRRIRVRSRGRLTVES
jgi:integrase